MKNLITLITFILTLFAYELIAQCANNTNVYSFIFRGHTYEVVKEKKTWKNASACAVERGGYLAEINDSLEQDSIFIQIISKANIVMSNTQNIFGTSALWIGGTDTLKEGVWIWDGNNDGIGEQFWMGGPSGVPVNGKYTKWGTSPAEPDNSGGQNHLCLTIDNRRVNYGKWNDIKSNDNIYYLIERDNILDIEDNQVKLDFEIYPNPVHDLLNIQNSTDKAISKIRIYNSFGQIVKVLDDLNNFNSINVSNLQTGIYFILVSFEDFSEVKKKFIIN